MAALDIWETNALRETYWLFISHWGFGDLWPAGSRFSTSLIPRILPEPPSWQLSIACVTSACIRTLDGFQIWLLIGCQESPTPQVPQGFQGLLLVQASTHFRRFSWLFLSPSGMNLCHSQLESEEEQQGSIYFLELLSDSLKVLLPARTASEFNNKRFWVSWFFSSLF